MGYRITQHDLNALGMAAALATKSTMRSRHGAVLFKRNKIIGEGYNQHKTHPGTIYYYKWGLIHAEFFAVHKVWDAAGYDLAVVRINKQQEFMNSQPCPECMALLINKGIRYVIYSVLGGFHKIKLGD